MNGFKNRIRLLFYILALQNDYIRAKDLALKAGVTERTIKSDMKDLAEYASQSGAQLVSTKGTGYKLLVKDEKQFDYIRNQLHMYYSAMGINQNEVKNRCNAIIRRILTEESYMTIEDVAEELFLTKSAIREEMKLVNQYLNKFRLRWKKKHEAGPLIQGDELNKRMLMLCVFENHYHEAVRMYKDDKFVALFDYDEQMRYEIRHHFLRKLRESGCHIRDDHTQRFARYLCLMVNRVKLGYTVHFSSEQRNYIKRLKQSQVAHLIMYELMSYSGFEQLPDDEILAFALLLAEYADISPSCHLEEFYPSQLTEAKQLLQEYEKVLLREYGIGLSEISQDKEILIRGLIPLLIQKDFDALEMETRIVSMQDRGIKEYPLAAQMAFDLVFLFDKKYGTAPTVEKALNFSSHLHSFLLSVNYLFVPVKALLFSWNGLDAGAMIKKIILKRYPSVFSEICIAELYEMRGIKTEDYDFVIMAHPQGMDIMSYAYKYEWPYFSMDNVPTDKQMNALYNRYILNGVQLKDTFSYLKLDRINVYNDVTFESEKAFIELISFKLGKDSQAVNTIQNSLQYRTPICCANKVCVLFIKEHLVGHSVFDIYELKSEMMFGEEMVSKIVVISFNFNGSLQAARFVNDISYMIFNDDSAIERICHAKNSNVLIDIVKESLKALPISLD